MEKEYYRIEDVAKKTGLTKRALRYYEDLELIKPTRTETSYRLYTEEDIQSILRIRELRDILGFSLDQIKNTFDLELDLKKILRGENQDTSLVEKSIPLIKNQILLIEEKEKTLERVKGKYKEILQKLEGLNKED